ncbi:hydroquinone glucosyltransferase-like [Senna tora]|uniref:Glycosyltransferase n=1 Tax=Senna tora TaxID=362788 RepID=A0A834TMD4_9FABA|nr:hydroquinone glucosyltransferase-like [Senna tora]
MAKTTHIAIVPGPLLSHLVSTIEFSKRLVHLHPNFHVTCIFPVLESPPSAFMSNLQHLPSSIEPIFLPPIRKHEMPEGAEPVVQIQLTVTKSLPLLRDLLKSLNSKTPLSALLSEPFSFELLDFAKEQLNTLSFVFFPSAAMVLSLFYYIPKLDQMISGEFTDLSEPIQIPGCVPLHGRDLPKPVQNRASVGYQHFIERAKKFFFLDGVLVNSFVELEEGTARALTKEGCENPPVYLIGPITQSADSVSGSVSDSECLSWLDKQPPRSVLFMCFGGGGTLSQTQINELAFGLEQSGKRFLWVLRVPCDSLDVSVDSSNEDPLEFLPEGFLERTKEQGLVVPSWAPQVQILAHSSTGGFLTNCGWNSILESVQHGVPLIAWPLFAEQKMNTVMLTNGLEVALRPKVNKNGIVERGEISKVVKSLMEGEEGKEVGKRMRNLKEAAANAVKNDGSSTKALSEVAMKWQQFCGI